MIAALAGYLIAALLLASPLAGNHHVRRHAPPRHHTPPPVKLRVAAGYGEQFRDQAWAPVRVTLRNLLSSTLSGTVSVSDTNNFNNQGPPLPYHSVYDASVVLPPGGTKQVTLYIPGYDISGEVDARFSSAGHPAATGTDYITNFGDEVMSIGTLASDPGAVSWLNRVNQNTTIAAVRLAPTSLDPVAQALANFDVIVISNVDSSQLDRDQLAALRSYVRNGGGLLLIGGPDWQETLRSLPPDLVPGRLTGSRTLPDLRGLAGVAGARSVARGASTVSVLAHPRGTVLASEGGVPLVVRDPVGSGVIEYLAFDPEISPIPHWSAAGNLLQHAITQASPLGANRAAQPANGPSPGPFGMQFGGPFDISSELANLPAAALPSLVLFIILTILFVLIIGPTNFLVLRRLRRRELMWVTVPALALACVFSTFGIAFHLKGSTVVLNTVGVVTMTGDGDHPATFYVGLFAPVRGDYHMTYAGQAMPSAVPSFNGYNGPGPQRNALGLRFDEGRQTGVTFVSMNMWSIRDVAIHTQVSMPGTIRAHLTLNRKGQIVGSIHNGMSFPLLQPVILAGQKIVRLKNIRAGGTLSVKLLPSADVFGTNQNSMPIGMSLYGRPRYQGYYYGGGFQGGMATFVGSGPFNGGGGYCCPGPTPPTEKTFLDRVRNVSSMLPDLQNITSLGEVDLVAWTEQSLGSFNVDGTQPHRRDLNAIEMPLHIGFPSGPFHLHTGTIGAHLVDDVPQQPLNNNGCCCPCPQPIYIGSGGSGTFEFDLPDSHTHFSWLRLWVNAGGALGTALGHVYNWQTNRWIPLDLSFGQATLRQPAQFISPQGAILLRLDANSNTGDISIQSVNTDIQLTGQVVRG